MLGFDAISESPISAIPTVNANVFGRVIAVIQNKLVGVGINQNSALLLSAQTNVISSAPPGTGFRLPIIKKNGTIIVQNDDPINVALIYPPALASIADLAIDEPFILGSLGARLNFSTQNSTIRWYVG